MKRKLAITIAALALSGIFSTGILACSSLGSTAHVGKILAMDLEKSTFTILDAETVSPVTFRADKEIMQQIDGAGAMALVEFTDDGVTLTATSIQIQ